MNPRSPLSRFALPAGAAVIVLAWFACFPPQPKLDFEDIVIEGSQLAAVVAGYVFVARLRVRMLEVGWGLFACALLIDFLDEWTREPDAISTVAQGILETGSLIVIAAGLYRSHGRWRAHMLKTEAAELRARESEAHYRCLFEDSPTPLWEEDWSGLRGALNELRESGVRDIRDHLESNVETIGKLAVQAEVTASNRASKSVFPNAAGGDGDEPLEPFGVGALRPALSDLIAELWAGKTSFARDYVIEDAGGGPRRLHVRVVMAPGFEASWARVLVSILDLTEVTNAEETRQALREKMREVRKLESLGALAGGVAHDFNNLLTSILGNANLARMELPPGDRIGERLKEIEDASERAADLCRQMLAYSGQGRFHMRDLDLVALIRDAGPEMGGQAAEGVEVELKLPDESVVVRGDGAQLKQALSALIANAIEAMEASGGRVQVQIGKVRVDSRFRETALLSSDLSAGDCVFVEVVDEGGGIDPATAAKIFDPFFSTKFIGRGLGLAAAQGIARAHNGAIQIESREGRGATFRLLLPVSRSAYGKSMPSETAAAEGRAGLPRALIVDDDDLLRRATRQMLQALGLSADIAARGQEAIESVRRNPAGYSVVFMDWAMPRMDGDEAIREIRRIQPRAKIVLMCGFSLEQATAKAGDLELAGFLQKPFNIGQIREILAKLQLDKHSAPGRLTA